MNRTLGEIEAPRLAQVLEYQVLAFFLADGLRRGFPERVPESAVRTADVLCHAKLKLLRLSSVRFPR
jgi:hypothetical protein